MARAYAKHGPYRPVAVKRYAAQEAELREKYYVGQKLVITKMRCDGEEFQTPVRKEYRVAGVYPHHLSCVDRFGIRESFGYFELEDTVVWKEGTA